MSLSKKGMMLLVAAACLALGAFAATSGNPAKAASKGPARDVPPVAVFSQTLTPSTNSEVILESVEATVYSDDSVRIRTAGIVRPGEHVRYSISVDLKSGLYTTKKQPFEPSVDEGEGYFINSDGQSVTPSDGTADTVALQSHSRATSTSQVLSINPGRYRSRVYVLCQDPVFIDLNETRNMLQFNVSTGGVVSSLGAYVAAWANPCTPLGTHWYTFSGYPKWRGPYVDPSYGLLSLWVAGSYWNLDFGNPNVYTFVDSSSQEWAYNDGHVYYVTDYRDSGEGATLTWGTVDAYVEKY